MRVRRVGSGSPATWNAVTRSMRSPVTGSIPGWIEPSDRSTAGALCSSTAASVPTGGLSHATTAITPATSLALQVRVDRVVHELAADQRVAHAVGAVELAVGHAEGVRRRDQAHRRGRRVGSAPRAPPGSASTFAVTPR